MNLLVICLAFYTFYNCTVTAREAGKCSATVSVTGQIQPARVLLRGSQRCYYSTLDHSSLPWMRMLKLTRLSVSPSVSCSQALFLLLLERWSSAHSLFVSLRPRPASLLRVFSLSRSFLGSAPLFCLFFLLHGDFLSLSILFISSLHKKKMEIKNRGVTVALDHFSRQAILVVQFSQCQCVECRVAG